MFRPRLTAALAGLGTTLLAAPILATVALASDEVIVRPGDTLTAIARRHDVSIERIVELNALSNPNRILVGQRLRLVPAQPAAAAPAAAAPTAPVPRLHTVRAGEHLTGIARHYGVTIAAVASANGLSDPSRIYAGQRLTIPGTAAASAQPATAAPAPAAAPTAPAPQVHTVRAGEHLTGIARHYGVTIAAVASANGLSDPGRIYAGQRLTIPGTAAASAQPATAAPAPAAAPTAPAPQVHTVRAGEHLTGIARQYGVTIAAVASANGLSDPSRIYAGQRLTIPGTAAAPVAASSGLPASMATLVAERAAVRRVIEEEATRYGVPPALALAVAWQESGWQQGVVSHANAVGVMQLLPATGEWVGSAMLGTTVDIGDLRQNVRAGVRLIAHYLDRYDGNRDLVLAAYYQGQTAVDRHGVYPVSRPYIASIRVLESLFGD